MISVIVPMFNAEKTISIALKSVIEQHTSEKFEIIVISDGSTDNSVKIVDDFAKNNPEIPIKILQQKNLGVSAARNTGLKTAKGEFIALLDADDEWLPEKTEKQLKFLKNESSKIDLIGSARNHLKINYPYNVQSNNLAEVTFRKLLFRNELQPSTVIFKRKILENTGFFDDLQRYAEDVNYWMRISEKNKMYILNESLVIAGGGKRTFGVAGLSANLLAMHHGFVKNIREMLYEKRISLTEFYAYFLLYKMKYAVLKIRTFLYNNSIR